MKTHFAKAWLAASLVAVVGLASTPAWAETETHSFSASTSNFCSGEYVDLTGTVTTDSDLNTDANGGVHISIIGRVRANGVGRDSGAQYKLNIAFATNFQSTGAGPWNFNDIQRSQLIGQGTTPNQYFESNIHFTVNANGDTTADLIQTSANCAPPQ